MDGIDLPRSRWVDSYPFIGCCVGNMGDRSLIDAAAVLAWEH